jgi:hypothetical protein
VAALVLRVSSRFTLGGNPVSARVCTTLQEAATQPYFFEHFFALCQKTISFGTTYATWSERTKRAMEEGKEIYFLGRPLSPQQS